MKKQKLKSWKRRQVMRGNSYCNARLQKAKTSQTSPSWATSPSLSWATSPSPSWATSSSTLFNFYSNAKSPKNSLRHVKCDKVQVVLGRKYNLYFWQLICFAMVTNSFKLGYVEIRIERCNLRNLILQIIKWYQGLLTTATTPKIVIITAVSEVASLSSWPGKGARARQRHLESHHCALYSDPHPFFTIAGIIIIITITITLISIPPIGSTPLLS